MSDLTVEVTIGEDGVFSRLTINGQSDEAIPYNPIDFLRAQLEWVLKARESAEMRIKLFPDVDTAQSVAREMENNHNFLFGLVPEILKALKQV